MTKSSKQRIIITAMKPTFFDRHPVLQDAIGVAIFIVSVIIGTVIINSFVFRSYSVVGPSMESTLYTGDRLIVNRVPSTISHIRNQTWIPERGDIVVFKNPQISTGLGDEYLVKRVIGLPGERVVVQNGEITVYNNDNPKEYEFRGSRVKRGLYKTSSGKIFNADVNGALNIMRKSRVVDMNILYSRGEVDTPIRIRIA